MVSLRKSIQSVTVLLLVNPILPTSSNPDLVSNLGLYTHCFESKEHSNSAFPGDSALQIGNCFLESAESLIPYFNENDLSNSPSRADIITALEYADSWFSLAITNDHPEAELGLRQTRLYIKRFSDISSSEF